MGICMSTSPPETLAAEKLIAEGKRELASQSKVLLLGGGDSGKSTILKQMRIINEAKFTPLELESYRKLVLHNLIQGMRKIIEAMRILDIPLSQEAFIHVRSIERAPEVRDDEPFPQSYFVPLQKLWEDPQIQEGLRRGNHLALPDNLTYFFPELPRLFAQDYKPSTQDIIHCRSKTTGITETVFRIRYGGTGSSSTSSGPTMASKPSSPTPSSSGASGILRGTALNGGRTRQIHMIDVGGQKSERRKWIHCFENVTAILFLVSLSGFDQCLVEERESNQMQDSLTIWDSVINNKWFVKTSIILFLNKVDLFTEKVKSRNIRDIFPDFSGPDGDAEAGREYFRKRFLRLAAKPSSTPNLASAAASGKKGTIRKRNVYPHYTTATSTPHIKVVMSAVSDIVLRTNLIETQIV